MIIKDPDASSYPSTFADWIELLVLSSDKKEATILCIRDLLDLDDVVSDAEGREIDDAEDPYSEDIQESQERIEEVISSFYEEIEHRENSLQQSYPFVIEDGGNIIKLKQSLNLGCYTYLFCLIMSNGSKGGLIEEPKDFITQTERDLFQICSTLCAAGSNRGPAYSIGYPRPDSSPFLAKMLKIHKALIPHIIIRTTLGAGAPTRVNDGGIDVISWTPECDGTGGIKYMLGQAASGRNWMEKSATVEIESFLNLYYDTRPNNPFPEMYIPFCVEAEPTRDYSFRERVNAEVDTQTRRLGHLYYRYRLPYYVQQIENSDVKFQSQIERFDEKEKITDWVRKFISN